jgi:hypothetical protein
MMKLLAFIVLCAMALAGRGAVSSLPRRYLAFTLVSVGALLWAATFDALRQSGSSVPDQDLYRRVIIWSVLGFVSSLGGLVAVFWCRHKPLRIFTVLVGSVSAFMCSVNILVPY